MKVLLVHNWYGSRVPSGENRVFDAERTLLRDNGHEVSELTRSNDEILSAGPLGALRAGLATAWNPWMARALRRKVAEVKPDVVHVHNTFPLLSPAVLHAAGAGTAKVMTLHNYRIFCAAGVPLRERRACTECLDRRSAWPALRHACYRGSRMATFPVAAGIALHRRIGTWTGQVDAFVALTRFQRERLVDAGLPASRIHIKPNFHAGNPRPLAWAERPGRVVYVGRLSSEKGIDVLLEAWRLWGGEAPQLRIVGDGPLYETVRSFAAAVPDGRVRLLGALPAREAMRQVANARLLVLPSICFETFGMAVVEAFAHGTPAAVSGLGPLPDIVRHGENGVVFAPGDAHALLCEVRRAWQAHGLLERLSAGARRSFETLYTASSNYRTLMAIYRRAVEEKGAASAEPRLSPVRVR